MTFVGGIGYFFGPVIGAILISFLQSTLSDVTDVWQLYFGLLFILVVLFSPGGIAGWLVLHSEVVRRGELLRLAPSYGLAGVPIAAGVCGGILLIELAHRVLVSAQTEGTLMTFFGIRLDASSVWPWLAALLLLGAGALFGKFLWPKVEAAWADIYLQRQKRKAIA
jgi:branched-chain amino acid transport system permease protein